MNLLTNASDALEDRPGRIEVTVSRVRTPGPRWRAALGSKVTPGNWISIEVTDTGAGMDEPTRRRVFEPFFSTKSEGRGLGLAASLGIVSGHGGAIIVESQLSRGSTFAVLLPAAEEAPRVAGDAAFVARAPGRRILVIDDEPLVRSHVRRLLEHHGFLVVEAHNGEAGLAALAQAPFDLLLIDVTMPDLDGAEVVRRVRASGSVVPIVLSSGYVDAAVAKGLDSTAFQGFLGKPYRMAELIDIVEEALAPV
jgi:two-component system cell cycle sensor histidine kinase/response regulator CckA